MTVTNQKSIVTPFVDGMLVGGLSILVFLFLLIVPHSADGYAVLSTSLVFVSLFINAPHFMASYFLFYGDFRRKIFSRWNWMAVGLIVPMLLATAICVVILRRDIVLLGYLVNFMFLTVGWHYSKQAFGAFIAFNAWSRYYPEKFERSILKIFIYLMWLLAWIDSNISARSVAGSAYRGVPFQSLPFEEIHLTLVSVFILICISILIFSWVKRYRISRQRPTSGSLICLLALVLWLSPLFFQPYFFLLIPIFHSLQYLLFVYGYKRSQLGGLKERNRQLMFKILILFFVGWLFMWCVPVILDLWVPIRKEASAWLVISAVFINVHHYFMDAVMWRKENEEMRSHLFAS